MPLPFRTVLKLSALIVSSVLLAQAARAQAPGAGAQASPAGDTLEARACLIMGYDLVAQYKAIGIKMDVDALIRGIRLAAEGQPMPIPEQDCEGIVNAFNEIVMKRQQELMEQQQAAMAAQAGDNLAAGNAFLEQNKSAEGVVVYESGVQHRVIRPGTGPSPAVTDRVRLHYTGRLINGKVFDSSVGGDPAEFPVGGVIRGMTEVLQKMKVGEKCEMFIPAHLAYGKNGPPVIGPDQVLIFEVELLEILR